MLALLSLLLLIISVSMAWSYRRAIVHPGFWTNLGFCGYAVGGFFYAISGFDGAKFLNLAKIDIDRGYWFSVAMAIVIAGSLCCNLGFWSADRRINRNGLLVSGGHELVNPFPQSILLLGRIGALVLIFLGVGYWLYFGQMIAGGILNQFANVAAYRYLAAKAGMSALPFHLAYAGIELWMLLSILTVRNRWLGLIFIPLGMIMILSTGRIALANAFGVSAVTAYILCTRGSVNWKTFAIAFVALAPINVSFYFFRQYSSYLYIGRAKNFPLLADTPLPATPSAPLPATPSAPLPTTPPVNDGASVAWNWWDYAESWIGYDLSGKIDYIMRSLIGGGNVPDLQQIILIVKGLLDGRLSLEYGATYFDWLHNLLGSRIGAPNTGIQSVGYRILEVYFPAKVGGPTPGMIGEAILNFGIAAPIALFVFTYGMTLLYGAVAKSSSVFTKLIYCKFLIGIWALFLKVDSSLLLGFLWIAGPISVCWLGLKILTLIAKKLELTPPVLLKRQG
jgi:hypothetical protein